MIVVELPIRTVSESNARDTWGRVKRTRETRGVVQLKLCAAGHAGRLRASPTACAMVVLTRIAPRTLDDDNLRGALKATRDGVADYLGVDDGSERVKFRYEQVKGPPKRYAVRIQIEEHVPADARVLEPAETRSALLPVTPTARRPRAQLPSRAGRP